MKMKNRGDDHPVDLIAVVVVHFANDVVNVVVNDVVGFVIVTSNIV